MALRVDTSGTDRLTRNDNPTGACSVFFFFRPAVVNRTFDVLFYAGDSAASTYENGVMIMFGDFGNRMEVWLRSTAFVFQGSAGQTYSAATWYWLACSYNTAASQAGNLYSRAVGGTAELGGSFTGGSAGTAVNEITEFGGDPTGDVAAQSRIAGARMWNAALTEAEFLREATSLTAVRRRDLWAGWTFQNDGNGLVDYSGNGRNLTETGTVTVEDGPPGIPMHPYKPVFFGESVVAPPAGIYLRNPFANIFDSRILA